MITCKVFEKRQYNRGKSAAVHVKHTSAQVNQPEILPEIILMLLTEIHQKQMMNLLIRAARAVSSTSLLKTEKQKRGVLEEKWAKTLRTVLKKM